MNKKKIIEALIASEENFIEKLSITLGEYKKASDLDEEATMDRQEMSQANEAKDMQLRLKLQYDKAAIDLAELKNDSQNNSDTVLSGSLIETDKSFYYVGVSVHSIEVEGKTLYGISSDSPAYSEVFGKTKGDSIKLGEHTHKIINLA
jgi:hypothetical protein